MAASPNYPKYARSSDTPAKLARLEPDHGTLEESPSLRFNASESPEALKELKR